MNLENIPNEVAWVWILNHSKTPVGLETYKEVGRIIDAYPKYFKQEHIYKSIPQEVKDAFEVESRSLFHSFYPPKLTEGMKDGEGLIAWLNRQPVNTEKPTKEKLEKSLHYIFTEEPRIKKEYKKELRKLHLKHYGKYKYKFEE